MSGGRARSGRRRPWAIPAVVESGRYASDLVVTNATDRARTLSFRLVSETLTTEDRTARFLAYGITNGGAIPGAGSDDGTYVPAR